MAKEAEEKESEKPQKKGKGKGLLIVIILLLLIVIGGGAAYFLILKKPAEVPQPEPVAAVEQGGAAVQPMQPTVRAPTAEPGPIQAYPAFLVNLADPGGNRYLKLTLALELSMEKNFQAEVTAKEPRIKDIIISVLSAKTYDEISTTQGKVAMKQELLRRLNTIMSGGRVNDIYITEFIVQ